MPITSSKLRPKRLNSVAMRISFFCKRLIKLPSLRSFNGLVDKIVSLTHLSIFSSCLAAKVEISCVGCILLLCTYSGIAINHFVLLVLRYSSGSMIAKNAEKLNIEINCPFILSTISQCIFVTHRS